MKTKKIQWLPIIIIIWNLVDIAVHVAVDMVEVLRVSGNVVVIGVAVLILIIGTKKWSHDVLIGVAIIVVILNSIFSFQAGFVVPMLVFVGGTVFLLIRWAQVKRLDYAAANLGEGEELQIRLFHRWWMALALTFVGVMIVALAGLDANQNNPQTGKMTETAFINAFQAQQQNIAEVAEELQRTDQITVVLCGVASPMTRVGAQTCTGVFVNGQFLLFDAGDGAMDSMRSTFIPIEEVDAVFITHYHNDHYSDLGDVMEWSWILGRRIILPIYGPPGIDQIVEGFSMAYELEATYRTAHHGEEFMPPVWLPSEAIEFEVPEGDEAVVIYENDGVEVKAFRANHEPVEPAVGYRIEYQGKVIVISGDTVSTTALLSNSQNADMLIAEAMNKTLVSRMQASFEEAGDEFMARVFYDVQDYHMDINEVAQLAKDANVQQLVLHHLAPRPNSNLQANLIFKSPVEEIFDGDVIVGQDGMQIIISLP